MRNDRERVSRIMLMHANEREPVEKLEAGEIGAVVGLKSTSTGDTLCDEGGPDRPRVDAVPADRHLDVDPARVARPTATSSPTRSRKLAKEDPTFKRFTDPETSETIIAGMGELHLDIIKSRLVNEYGVHSEVGKPKVAYRQTFRKATATSRASTSSSRAAAASSAWCASASR